MNNLSLFSLQILKIKHWSWTCQKLQNYRNIWSYPVSAVPNRSAIERKWFQQDVVKVKIPSQFGLNASEVFKRRISHFSRDLLANRLKFHSIWSFQFINDLSLTSLQILKIRHWSWTCQKHQNYRNIWSYTVKSICNWKEVVSARRCNGQNHDPVWLKGLRSFPKRISQFSRDLLAIRL